MLWMSRMKKGNEAEEDLSYDFFFLNNAVKLFSPQHQQMQLSPSVLWPLHPIQPGLISWIFAIFSYNNNNNNNNNNLPEMFPKQCASLYIITCFCIKRIHYNPLWPVYRVFLSFIINLISISSTADITSIRFWSDSDLWKWFHCNHSDYIKCS